MQAKIKRVEAVDLFDQIERQLGSDKEIPLEFFYFLRRNRDKLKGEVAAIRETNGAKVRPYYDKLRADKALAGERSATPNKILDVKKYEEITEEFAPVLKESEDFLAAEIEVELYECKGDVWMGTPARLLDKLLGAGIVTTPAA